MSGVWLAVLTHLRQAQDKTLNTVIKFNRRVLKPTTYVKLRHSSDTYSLRYKFL